MNGRSKSALQKTIVRQRSGASGFFGGSRNSDTKHVQKLNNVFVTLLFCGKLLCVNLIGSPTDHQFPDLIHRCRTTTLYPPRRWTSAAATPK